MPALGAIVKRVYKKTKKTKKNTDADAPPSEPQDNRNSEEENKTRDQEFGAKYHHGKTRLGKFLQLIDPFIIVLIAVNALMMGIGTFDFVEDNQKVNDTFELVDQIFLIIFTIEVTLNATHYMRLDRLMLKDGKLVFPPQEDEERKERASNKSWLIFDALVVIMSWAFASVSIIRAFRILRALRLIAKIKSMRSVILALTRVLPKMVMVGFLLIIIFLVFGIMFTELFGDLYKNGYTEFDYYGRIDLTLLTLFQIMTFDNFGEMAREVMDKYPLAWIPLILFAIITGFVIVNLIIAIICESLAGMDDTGIDALHGASDLLQSIHSRSNILPPNDIVPQASLRSLNTSVSDLMDDSVMILSETVSDILEEQKELERSVTQLQAIIFDLRAEIAYLKGISSDSKTSTSRQTSEEFSFSILNPLGELKNQ